MLQRFFCPILAIIFSAISLYSQSIEKTVLVTPPEKDQSRYFYIPFEVPAGVRQFSVSYSYDKKNGSNVLDLGLLDPRFDVNEKNPTGFRGWSGGRRTSIFIAQDSATNGYLPGDIQAGTWQVILGLYKVNDEGVEVKIKIDLNMITEQAKTDLETESKKIFNFAKTEPAKTPASNGYKWFRGDLHMHSFHSDGHWTLNAMLDYAEANELDFVGITEHNTSSHHAQLASEARSRKKPLIMIGEEVTTYGGHFNVWGLPEGELIDFRVTPGDAKRLLSIISNVHQLGAKASINHPTALCGGCSWSYSPDWNGLDSVEVWNGFWDITDELAFKKWDVLLQSGRRITAIGSSDSHVPPLHGTEIDRAGAGATISVKTDANQAKNTDPPIGLPTTFAGAARLSQKEILEAISRHRVFVSETPSQFVSLTANKAIIGEEVNARSGEKIDVEVKASNYPAGARVKIVTDGRVVFDRPIESERFFGNFQFTLEKSSYVRAEIRRTDGGMLGFTNPVFINIK